MLGDWRSSSHHEPWNDGESIMAGHDWKIIRDGFVAALVAFATIGGVGGSKLAAGEKPGLASEGPPEQKGSWFVPPLPAEKDRLQSIHAVLLPNGKVLMV